VLVRQDLEFHPTLTVPIIEALLDNILDGFPEPVRVVLRRYAGDYQTRTDRAEGQTSRQPGSATRIGNQDMARRGIALAPVLRLADWRCFSSSRRTCTIRVRLSAA
jgi:hypothetical protein